MPGPQGLGIFLAIVSTKSKTFQDLVMSSEADYAFRLTV